MLSDIIKLIVFDMAGTTVRDQSEVESCFHQAAVATGLPASMQRIKDMQGLPKLKVVETLWDEAIGREHPTFQERVKTTYQRFTEVLEDHYRKAEVVPTDHALETFDFIRAQGIKIALTTGFYRRVTDIILQRLGWNEGLDDNYQSNAPNAFINLSLTPDETGKGRPHPDMILAAMERLGITDASQVVKIGDTPSDLLAGKAAGCALSLGVTNGTHSEEALAAYDNDGLLSSLAELPERLKAFAQSTVTTS